MHQHNVKQSLAAVCDHLLKLWSVVCCRRPRLIGIGGNHLPVILLTELIHGSYLCINGFASLIIRTESSILCYPWYVQHVTTPTGK